MLTNLVVQELEFLADTNQISRETLQAITAQLSSSEVTGLTTALARPTVVQPAPTPVAAYQPPTSYSEKAHQPAPTPYQPAPPAYNTPPTLSVVSAIYAYQAADVGDLAINPGDTINVTEYVNPDWWRGINTQTNATGIFPRAYVKEGPPATKEGYGYGNVPLQVANGMRPGQEQQQQQQDAPSGKVGQFGKSVGKKLGNAAVFGAGATIGGNIVNSIF